jgi:hypothetical protein
LDALIAWVQGGGRLWSRDRKDFNAFHVLLDVGAINVTDHGSAWHQGRSKYALRKLRARGAPRGEIAVQTRDFDLNASRHRVTIYSFEQKATFQPVLVPY